MYQSWGLGFSGGQSPGLDELAEGALLPPPPNATLPGDEAILTTPGRLQGDFFRGPVCPKACSFQGVLSPKRRV